MKKLSKTVNIKNTIYRILSKLKRKQVPVCNKCLEDMYGENLWRKSVITKSKIDFGEELSAVKVAR